MGTTSALGTRHAVLAMQLLHARTYQFTGVRDGSGLEADAYSKRA